MKVWFAAALLSGLSFAATSAAHAQIGPAFPAPAQGTSEEGARRTSGNNAQELARNQRRAAMTPDQIKHDQQLELLEARTGNTSFGGRNGGPERQFDNSRSGGGFMVRKFKAKAGSMEQKRGMSHPIGAANPMGKPLVHKHNKRKNKFLFF